MAPSPSALSPLEFAVVYDSLRFSLEPLQRFFLNKLYLDGDAELRGKTLLDGFLELALLFHLVKEHRLRHLNIDRRIIKGALAINDDLIVRGNTFDLEQHVLDLLWKNIHTANDQHVVGSAVDP